MSVNSNHTHSLLMHLEQVGFSAAPRFENVDDQGREILTYIEGEVPHNVKDTNWTEDQLRIAASLLRDFHDATAGTEFAGSEEVVCHNGFAPWNLVFVKGLPFAIIDFDDAAPGARIKDLSYALWCWLGLGSEKRTLDVQIERMRIMCDEYGIKEPTSMVDEIAKRQEEVKVRHLLAGRIEQAEGIEDDMAWLCKHKNIVKRNL